MRRLTQFIPRASGRVISSDLAPNGTKVVGHNSDGAKPGFKMLSQLWFFFSKPSNGRMLIFQSVGRSTALIQIISQTIGWFGTYLVQIVIVPKLYFPMTMVFH